MAPLTPAEIEQKLRGENLDAWLELWREEQGPAKAGAMRLMAAAIPFPPEQALRVLDIGCGTGDAGRAIHGRYPRASIDSVDRNEFFVALCGMVKQRDGVAGRTLHRDVVEADWYGGLGPAYDVVVAVNSLHWLSLAAARRLLREVHGRLRPGGVFALMEPASAEPPFTGGFEAWRNTEPSQHRHEDWVRFWERVRDLVGTDYGFLGAPDGRERIGDGLSVARWVELLGEAGFAPVEVLLRDAEKVMAAGVRR